MVGFDLANRINETMRILSFLSGVCFVLSAHVAIAQPTERFKVADTSSPRDTLRSFIDRGLTAFRLLANLLTLQAGDVEDVKPVLTLPVGG